MLMCCSCSMEVNWRALKFRPSRLSSISALLHFDGWTDCLSFVDMILIIYSRKISMSWSKWTTRCLLFVRKFVEFWGIRGWKKQRAASHFGFLLLSSWASISKLSYILTKWPTYWMRGVCIVFSILSPKSPSITHAVNLSPTWYQKIDEGLPLMIWQSRWCWANHQRSST